MQTQQSFEGNRVNSMQLSPEQVNDLISKERSMPTKKRTKSPTARALQEMRDLGFVAGGVEQTIPRTFIKRDFCGWCDIIYLTGKSIVGVQVTDASNHAHRRVKILAEPRALVWLRSGGLIEIWSYAKQGAIGEQKRWKCRKEEIVATDFA